MIFEEALQAHLVADAGVSALIGTRVYPDIMPPGSAKPAAVYTLIGNMRGSTLCATDTLVAGQYQIDAYATSYKASKLLAKALFGCLADYKGVIGEFKVSRIFILSEVDLDDPDPGLYRVSQTYQVWYRAI